MSWQIANGKPVPADLVVRHQCDTPACVNPDHLLIGTPADNVRDSIVRGRKPRGEMCAASKMTDAQRSDARAMYDRGATIESVASAYGVTGRVIGRFIHARPAPPPPKHLGDTHPHAVLTCAMVREAFSRRLSGETVASIARSFGISAPAVSAALTGRTWGHVEIARERLRAHPTKPKAGTLALPWETE